VKLPPQPGLVSPVLRPVIEPEQHRGQCPRLSACHFPGLRNSTV
jgi:hypothetical protein